MPTPGGGISTSAALLKQNRPLVLNFLKGYIEGIHYMIGHKPESLKILQRYFQNSTWQQWAIFTTKPHVGWKRTARQPGVDRLPLRHGRPRRPARQARDRENILG